MQKCTIVILGGDRLEHHVRRRSVSEIPQGTLEVPQDGKN